MNVERSGSQLGGQSGNPEQRETARGERPQSPGPRRTTIVLLVLYLAGICSRGTGFYGVMLQTDASRWTSVMRGTADAPEQYRVGVVRAGFWAARHLGLRVSLVFGAFDLVASLLAVFLLYRIFESTQVYRRSSLAMQWLASASFAALTVYCLDWTTWYQKVETLPATAMVALMLWLWTPRDGFSRGRQWGTAVGFVALAAALAMVRADVAAAVCGGIFFAGWTKISPRLALPRAAAMATSLAALMVVLGIQLYLMRVAYPHATYGGVHAFMLKHDFKRITKWASLLIFTAPFLWTALQAWRRRYAGEGAAGAFLLAGIGYLGLWVVMGRLDEVRIFIPMAMANLPLTVEMLLREVQQAEAEAERRGSAKAGADASA